MVFPAFSFFLIFPLQGKVAPKVLSELVCVGVAVYQRKTLGKICSNLLFQTWILPPIGSILPEMGRSRFNLTEKGECFKIQFQSRLKISRTKYFGKICQPVFSRGKTFLYPATAWLRSKVKTCHILYPSLAIHWNCVSQMASLNHSPHSSNNSRRI